jgi:hydroxymethylglutaryl-CoA lyase
MPPRPPPAGLAGRMTMIQGDGRSVEIVEVSPRDGLQNEPDIVGTADKIALIGRAVTAGVRRIEVASFVNPRKVPQMADAEAVIAGLPAWTDVTTIGLVLNQRGAERALATKVSELGAVCVASDAFGIRNQSQTSEQSLRVACDIMAMAQAANRSAQITIAVAFGCPFEGDVPAERVVAMARVAAAANPREIALADTIGVAVPRQVAALVTQVRAVIGTIPLRIHLHNTRNTGLANMWAAVEAGAATIDAAIGGIGGCPFAPGAAGNVATEDVLYLLNHSGVATGLDLQEIIATSSWLAGVMGRQLPAMVSRAGDFPVQPTP